MRIAVAGTGYVGLVTGVCLAELGHHVICLDILEEKIDMLNLGHSPIYEPGLEQLLQKNLRNGLLQFTTNPKFAYEKVDIIFIAVGTPKREDGSAGLDSIYEVATSIANNIKNDVIVCTKSTVPVGTNYQISQIIDNQKPPNVSAEVVANPEFLREGSAIVDFFNGDRIVIGTEKTEIAETIEELYLPLQIPIMKTDIRSAEMIKYVSNAFLATKISFINEIAAICEKVGANIDEVAYGIGRDKRIGQSFLCAGIGYGGSCFPKDTKALIQLAGNIHHDFELLDAVIKVNNRQKSLPVQKAVEVVGALAQKKVAVLGLAFKPDTDDIREAAALTIIQDLLMEGAVVTAYDPVAIPNAEKVLGRSINYTTDVLSALYDADLAIIATEWSQIKHMPLELIPLYMKQAIIIDGRNCFSITEIKKHPISYISIGRQPIIKKYGSNK